MKQKRRGSLFATLLSIILLFGACAPNTPEHILPDNMQTSLGDGADAGTYLAGIDLVDMKKVEKAVVSFDRALYIEGGDVALFFGGMAISALFDAYNGDLFVYRNYPLDMITSAVDFVRKADDEMKIEIYDTSITNGVVPKRTITLQGLRNQHIVVNDMLVDADGVFLYASTCDFDNTGKPNFATSEDGVYHFDFDGKFLSHQPASLRQGYSPLNLIRTGGETYLLVSDILRPESKGGMSEAEAAVFSMRQADFRRLCTVDQERGTVTPLERKGMEDAALLGAVSYPDGRILCMDFVVRETVSAAAGAIQLSCYNPADGTADVLTYAFIGADDYIASQMSYDETTDTLFFFFRNNEIYAWQLGTAAPIAQLTRIENVQVYDSVCAVNGTLLYMTKSMQIERFSNFALPEGDTLSAQNADKIAFGIGQNTQLSILASTVEKTFSLNSAYGDGCGVLEHLDTYCSAHDLPGFTLAPTYLGLNPYDVDLIGPDTFQSYLDSVAKKLLAGDDDFDLFFIGGQASYADSLGLLNGAIKNGYLYPLNKLGLEPLYDEMLPGIKELCSADGQILLVPISLDFEGFMLHPDVLQTLGITADEFPRTATELIQFMDIHNKAVNAAGYVMFEHNVGAADMRYHTQAQYVTQFFEGEINTQEMWDIRMKLLEACYAYEDKAAYGSGATPLFFRKYTTNMIFGMRQKWDYSLSGIRYMPVVPAPLLTAGAKYPLEHSVFIGVNPNSKNLDAVAEFLRIFLSRSYIDYALEKSQMLKSSEDFNAVAGGKEVLTALYDLPQLDPELYPAFAYYKEMLQNATRGYPRHLDYPQLDAFLAQELTGDEWKNIADRELEFLRDE